MVGNVPHPDEDQVLEFGPSTEGEDTRNRRMWKYFQLRPHPRSQMLPRCLRVVAGKRCTRGYPSRSCSCRNHQSHLFDHVRFWRDETLKQTVMTLEPYGIYESVDHPGGLLDLLMEASALQLDVHIEGYSPYYPGHSVLVMIRPRRTTTE